MAGTHRTWQAQSLTVHAGNKGPGPLPSMVDTCLAAPQLQTLSGHALIAGVDGQQVTSRGKVTIASCSHLTECWSWKFVVLTHVMLDCISGACEPASTSIPQQSNAVIHQHVTEHTWQELEKDTLYLIVIFFRYSHPLVLGSVLQ